MDLTKKVDRNKLTYRQSTSAVIIDKSGRLLFVQKASWQKNEWDLPGCGVEINESTSQAIKRELSEELGLDNVEIIKISDNVDRYEWPDWII